MTALVIDEAQRLAPDVLEEIRLLASMETKSGKLMTVVIAGQPELAVRLDTSRLRKLNQQIGLRCELRPLAPRETAMYLAERIRSAGGAGARLFTREAVSAIYEQSHGMPRLINVIADSALLAGYAVVQRPVGADIVREVCRDVVPRKSVGRPSALESARALVSQGRAYNGGATAAIPSFVAVYEPAPMVEVIPEPAIAREVVPQVTTAVEEIQELPIAVAVVPEPAIEVETVPEPAIALTAAADPVIAVAALPEPVAFAQRVTTPPPAEPSASDDDDSEIKEIFFSTYFQKVWEGPQETG
jgi:hypothetical protein